MTDAIIISGAGRYSDPWHPFAETTAALAALVLDAGFRVRVADDPDVALAAMDDAVCLIVVNAGDPHGHRAVAPGEAEDAHDARSPGDHHGTDTSVIATATARLSAAIDRGVGILAMHTAAASLRDYPAFERALGARWVRGQSWHPPIGLSRVHLVGPHDVAKGLEDFQIFDERYTDFRFLDVIEPIAEHDEGGARHPLVWARTLGRTRVVYDALGHDARSYASPGHRALLARALEWLSGASPAAPVS